jgi:DNA-binding SARP family transcriptional activator
MVSQEITKMSFEAFRQRSAGKKVVLLYPWTNYRNLFLTHFLSNTHTGLLYYRIAEEQSTLSGWLNALVAEFDQVLDHFGDNLKQALQGNKPEALGEALAADLGAYSSEPVVLFIDEFDKAPLNGDFRKIIKAAVAALPGHVQLAFSSRLLTYQPWYDMVSQGEALVLGTEYRKDDVMFTVEPTPRPQLEVYSLGRGYAIVNGQQITNWDGALPRNLFFYFMDHPLVTRDEIFATFWPDLSIKEATNVFHVTKRKISERISMKVGGSKNYELTQYSGGFYMPSEKIVRHYDVADFQDAIERSMIASDDRKEEELLSQAIELYKAPFLQTVSMQWTSERRDQLRQLYAQALISMARINKRRENFHHALGFFVRALKETPEREDIHREVMSIYLKLDMVEDALMQYRTLEQILSDTLGIGPSRESRELYTLIETRR